LNNVAANPQQAVVLQAPQQGRNNQGHNNAARNRGRIHARVNAIVADAVSYLDPQDEGMLNKHLSYLK